MMIISKSEGRARYHDRGAAAWRQIGREDLAKQREMLAAHWRKNPSDAPLHWTPDAKGCAWVLPDEPGAE